MVGGEARVCCSADFLVVARVQLACALVFLNADVRDEVAFNDEQGI